eukprot:gene16631-biopygen10611
MILDDGSYFDGLHAEIVRLAMQAYHGYLRGAEREHDKQSHSPIDRPKWRQLLEAAASEADVTRIQRALHLGSGMFFRIGILMEVPSVSSVPVAEQRPKETHLAGEREAALCIDALAVECLTAVKGMTEGTPAEKRRNDFIKPVAADRSWAARGAQAWYTFHGLRHGRVEDCLRQGATAARRIGLDWRWWTGCRRVCVDTAKRRPLAHRGAPRVCGAAMGAVVALGRGIWTVVRPCPGGWEERHHIPPWGANLLDVDGRPSASPWGVPRTPSGERVVRQLRVRWRRTACYPRSIGEPLFSAEAEQRPPRYFLSRSSPPHSRRVGRDGAGLPVGDGVEAHPTRPGCRRVCVDTAKRRPLAHRGDPRVCGAAMGAYLVGPSGV